mgnify:CR=1 FL=1
MADKIVGKMVDGVFVPSEPDVDPQTLRIMAQGPTLAYADEIEAGLRTGFGLLGDYPATLREINVGLQEAREAYPVSSLAKELGGVAIPAIGLGLATGGASVPAVTAPVTRSILSKYAPSVLKSMGIGGAGAGIYEFGSAVPGDVPLGEAIQERFKGVPTATAIGAVTAPPFQFLVSKALGGVSALADFASRRLGGRAGKKVEAEIQEYLDRSGITVDELIENVRAGSIPADVSETLRQTLRAYKPYITDEVTKRIRERPEELREKAFGLTQEILTGDATGNVLAKMKEGFQSARADASKAYDEVFEQADDLPETITPMIEDIFERFPSLLKPIRDKMVAAKVKDPFYKINKDGSFTLTKLPTLREAEILRRLLQEEKSKAFKSGDAFIGDILDDLEKSLRSSLDEMSPVLGKTREVWSNIESGSRAFDKGRAAFTKSADEQEIIFSQVVEAGPDAVKAFRAGFADAVRSKQKGPKTFPGRLASEETKEGAVFRMIFPEDEYEKAIDALDRAAKSQTTSNVVLSGSQTAETTARRKMIGEGGAMQDLGDVVFGLSPRAAMRLVARALKVGGKQMDIKQQQEVAKLLISEDPELLRRALADDSALTELSRKITQMTKGVTAVSPVMPAPVISNLTGSRPTSTQLLED